MVFNRRKFIQSISLSSLLLMPDLLRSSNIKEEEDENWSEQNTDTVIDFISDGINFTPSDYSKLLLKITQDSTFKKDNEGKGGVVQKLEEEFAKFTGKQKAIYMPSGTMANQLAIRVLSGNKSKVYVQEDSHVFNNESDAAQSLHHKRLMPLAKGKATFTLEELKADIKYFKEIEIFKTEIGAISIENPVKRLNEEVFDINEIRKIAEFAKKNQIKMHLDGARLHMASAYSGISIKEYCSYFDTVYISLYKYLGASAGAILCGDNDTISQMPHFIKICGGNMATNWTTTAVAYHNLNGFEERYAMAKKKADKLLLQLENSRKFQVKRIKNGSNVFFLKPTKVTANVFKERLKREGIFFRNPDINGFIKIKINETILRSKTEHLITLFNKANS